MTERVVAAQVRPADTLVSDEGPLFVHDVRVTGDQVGLLTNGAWWTVRATTRFVRLARSRRIEMGRKANRDPATRTKGSATSSPAAPAAPIGGSSTPSS